MDLSTLADADLVALRIDVADEQERRNRLADAPAQVAAIAAQYVEDGGDLANLTAALP